MIVYLKVPGKVLGALDSALRRHRPRSSRKRASSAPKPRPCWPTTVAAPRIPKPRRQPFWPRRNARPRPTQKRRATAFDETIARLLAVAEQKIKLEEEKARKQIRAQAAELAIAAAGQLIEQKVTGQVAENMITASLDRIKKRLH